MKQKEEERECTFKPKIQQQTTRKKSRSLSQNAAKKVEKPVVK
jgi:hypothetical protein